jgi:hypothetical protein
MVKLFLVWLKFWFLRAKARLLPAPKKKFFVQCEQCPDCTTHDVYASNFGEALKQISDDYLTKHRNHKVGIYSADGKQDEPINWASV